MISGIEWLPGGAGEPPRPAPALMTACEAAQYLRLTEGRDIGDALASLEYLVAEGRIRPCRVGRFNRFTRVELDRFMQEQTEQYPRKYSSGRAELGRGEKGGGGDHDRES